MTNDTIYTIPERWTSAWSTDDAEPWITLYAPSGRYIDHAFQSHRTGHTRLRQHHGMWRHANPDFIMTIDPSSPVWWRNVDESKGDGECSFRTFNKGTMVNELPIKQASGKKFVFKGVIDMVIRGGKIEVSEEWYSNVPYDESVEFERYRT